MLEAIREIALLDNPSTHRFIGICMGGHGKSTRSIGPYLGSDLTYACLDGKPAAPDQVPIKDLVYCADKLGFLKE